MSDYVAGSRLRSRAFGAVAFALALSLLGLAAAGFGPPQGSSGGGSADVNQGVNQLRLTLASGTPVTTTDQTSKSTIYLTPFKGNVIHTYDSSTWTRHATAEVSLALSGLTDASNYDLFAYWTGSAVALETLIWTNDTTRATALVYQDGVLCKTGDLSRRYVGTFRTTSTTTTESSTQKRFLWNYNNRVKRRDLSVETTGSWTNAGNGTYTAVNSGDATFKHEFVIGVEEGPMQAGATLSAVTGAYVCAITLDSTSAADRTNGTFHRTSGDVAVEGAHPTWQGYTGIGYHYFQAIESTLNATSATVYGDNAGDVTTQSGMFVIGQR